MVEQSTQGSSLDLSAIRRTLERGDPVWPALVLEIVDRLEHAEADAAHYLRRCQDDLSRVGNAYADAFGRIDQLTADIGAWWWIVNDLHMLGCLDCSNAACDRARQALVAVHPGRGFLDELSAAREYLTYVLDTYPPTSAHESSLRGAYTMARVDSPLADYRVWRLAPLLTLLHAGRAWRDAVEAIDGIAAAEQALLAAIKGCEL